MEVKMVSQAAGVQEVKSQLGSVGPVMDVDPVVRGWSDRGMTSRQHPGSALRRQQTCSHSPGGSGLYRSGGQMRIEGKVTSLLAIAHPANVALGPEEEIGVVARSSSSSSNSISSSNSQAALVVAVEDPEVGVAPGGAGHLRGKSFAMAVVGLATLLPTAQMLQQKLWM